MSSLFDHPSQIFLRWAVCLCLTFPANPPTIRGESIVLHLYAEVQIPGKRMEFMNHEDKVTFTINQVAKILGVVPATIRNWEKNGMISSKRSASNYRIFTLDDIETLKKIKEYSVDKHMGTQAIKMLLPSPEPARWNLTCSSRKKCFTQEAHQRKVASDPKAAGLHPRRGQPCGRYLRGASEQAGKRRQYFAGYAQ